MLVLVLYWYLDHCFFLGQNNFNGLKNMKIGTWNIITLKINYHINILTDEFRRFELDLLGIQKLISQGSADGIM